MSKEYFESKVKSNGSDNVWEEKGVYYFSIGMDVMDYDGYFDLEESYENIDGVDFMCAMGDDVCHCVGVGVSYDLENDEVLKEFIDDYIGSSGY